MKRFMLILFACFALMLNVGNAYASEKASAQQNPMDWEISMMPKPTAEEIEAARWSVVVENDLGIYAYDMGSLGFEGTQEKYDKNTVNVLVKTLFTNKDVLKKLKKDYADKLEGKEKVLYCLMDMQYKMAEKTYTVKKMEVFTNKDKQVDLKNNKAKFAPIPEGSFAEALYEVCQKFVADVEAMQAAAAQEQNQSKK